VVLFTLFMGDDMAVRIVDGKQIESSAELPELWNAVETASLAAGVKMPRIFVSPDPSANAFAAGRSQDQALVCVTRGLLERLDKEELEGVIAHEVSHIRNLDVRLMTYAAVLGGSVAVLSQLLLHLNFWGDDGPAWLFVLRILTFVLAILLAPVAALIIQSAISRRREFLADASAADLTRYPQGLASALRQITSSGVRPGYSHQAIAHLYIVAPAALKGNYAEGLFSTHPPLAERLARLDGLAGGQLHPHRPRTPSAQLQEILGAR
jgi:heat shock protein HtpX